MVADELQEAVGPDGEAPGCIIWKDPTGLMQTRFEEGQGRSRRLRLLLKRL